MSLTVNNILSSFCFVAGFFVFVFAFLWTYDNIAPMKYEISIQKNSSGKAIPSCFEGYKTTLLNAYSVETLL